MSAITLRSGKQCQEPQPANEPAQPHPTPEKDDDKNLKSKLPTKFYAGESFTGNFDLQKQRIPLPFPPREISNKTMEEAEKEILETFRK